MPRQFRLLAITFLATLAETIAQRGSYFYCKEQFHFTDSTNLQLAVTGGLLAMIGARVCGPISRRQGARNWLTTLYVAVPALGVMQMIHPSPVTVFVGASLVFFCSLGTWPIIESYISAGLHGQAVSRTIGRFNISWALGIPTGLILAGPLIQIADRAPWAMFAAGVLFALMALVLTLTLEPEPVHLPDDHEHRPTGDRHLRMTHLMRGSRWMMLCHTTMMFIVAPLIPGITQRIGLTVVAGTLIASVIDVLRVVTFTVMQRTAWWHDRRNYLVAIIVVLPIGFLMILLCEKLATTFEPRLLLLIAGQLLAGTCGPAAYATGLYYAMVLHNASVDAGGEHEGMAAIGLALGPGAAIVGRSISLSSSVGTIVGVAPVWCFCALRSARALLKAGAPVPSPSQGEG